MKIDWNRKYNTIAVYALIVIIVSILFYLAASGISLFRIKIGKYISTMYPIIIGFVMAYIFNFILEFYEEHILLKVFDRDKQKKLYRLIGVFMTYLTIFLLLFLFLNFILPQLISSIVGLVNDIPRYVTIVSRKIKDLDSNIYIEEKYYNQMLEKWNEIVDQIVDFVADLVPKLGNAAKNFLSSIWNIVLGLIVSIYLLIDKERFMASGRKLTSSIFSEKNTTFILHLIHRGDHIFGRFLTGKILDSFIIGALTFIVLTIVKMPYAILISFIIGITNIIPFFGPFIGAVPSFFVVLFVSPIKALWLLLIIFIIQQIDGNIIGPKILGDSLGISAFWILFSLLVAGKLLGFVGLIIGVPLFVLIYSIVVDLVEYRLKKKGLPIDTKEYYKKNKM